MKKFSTIGLIILMLVGQYSHSFSYITCKLENIETTTCDCEKILERDDNSDGLPEFPATNHQHRMALEEYLMVEKVVADLPTSVLLNTRPAAGNYTFHIQTVYNNIFRPPCSA